MKECMPADKNTSQRKLKYNYVFFFARYDFWHAVLGEELYNNDQVHIYKMAFNGNKLLEKLFYYHWAVRSNRRFKLPFKNVWFKKMYRQNFKNDLPLCFVYMGDSNILCGTKFTDYVRKQDPRNRQVIIFDDLISKGREKTLETIRKKVDLLISYDKGEAEKYGVEYFQEDTYSKLIEEPETPNFKQDVYFLGAAKDRLPKIMATYEKLHSNGVSCKFMLAGVPEEQRIVAEGIEYTTGISYMENLQNVLESRCVLEIIQGGSCDITMRALEAIAYRRKFATDCQICEDSVFNPGQFQSFTTVDELDVDFFKEPFMPVDYPIRLDMNPMRRLYFIQEQLENHNHE